MVMLMAELLQQRHDLDAGARIRLRSVRPPELMMGLLTSPRAWQRVAVGRRTVHRERVLAVAFRRDSH